MLYLALICSAILLIAVNLATRRGFWTTLAVSVLGLFVTAAPFFVLNLSLPVLIVNAALLVFVTWVWRFTGQGSRRMLVYSILATITAYGVFLPSRLERHAETARILARYPFVSMEHRAPLAPEGAGTPAYDSARFEDWVIALTIRVGVSRQDNRTLGLKLMHDHAVGSFVESWGFGVGRMPPTTERGFGNFPVGVAPEQPGKTGEAWSGETVDVPRSVLEQLHFIGAFDFVRPETFGVVRDRANVSGFESHRVRVVPSVKEVVKRKEIQVKVARLELVSLLMHPEPRVYLSDRLPQMDSLKGVPTRPLDPFEADGLTELRNGEDLYVRETRMLGSIRNARQCTVCHGGERGQLLGAFTYVLLPATSR